MSKAKIVVHGATGMQGRPVIAAFLAEGYHVHAVSRGGWRGPVPNGVTPFKSDLTDPADLVPAYDGVEAAMITLPGGASDPSAVQQAEVILDTCKKASLPRAIFNSSGALWDKPTGIPTLDARTLLAEGLGVVVDEAAVIGPVGMFYEVFSAEWVVERIRENHLLAGPIPPNAPFQPVAMEDLAGVMVQALEDEVDVWGARSFVVGPDEITGEALAAAVSQRIGQKITYEYLSADDHMSALATGFSQQYATNLASLYGPGAHLPPASEPGPGSRLIKGKIGLGRFVESQMWT